MPHSPTIEDYAFTKLSCYAVYQWKDYQVAAHHRLICEKLEAVERGEIKRLMITMPPRHGKSVLASEYFPAWYLGRNPTHQVIHVTYGQELASGFGRKVRNQLADERYKKVFATRHSPDSTAAHRFHTTDGGVYHAVGMGGAITGKGANLLIIDDPVRNREDAESAGKRQKMKDWFQSVAYTRLMPNGAVVIIQTRWHEDDLSGWLLKEHAQENWTVLSLPAISEEGQALWREAYPIERLLKIKEAVGSRDWNALYQQNPIPSEGGIIKVDWLKRYETLPVDKLRLFQSWDTAYKAKLTNDPSVCTTWLQTKDGKFYLIESYVMRGEYADVKRAIQSKYDQFKPQAVLIEDKASGQSLIQELRHTPIPVIAIQPNGDKITRLNSVSTMFEAGQIFLPERAAWLADYEHELLSFPLAAHDDQVDSTSQALEWAKGKMINALPIVGVPRRF